ncbi:MAG: SUMF1/EgtB/PvdO family nonheme iron enzyme [Candidatus Brocadiaceae bacterium]|nr:SUMF1/EgtB/PvdO family nonheme iron enzyme [Candidatus Brocadiaceae bacterium]
MDTENKPVHIISDEPEGNSDLFGFGAYASTIAGLIANKENKTPLVIGIYGSWGSGKTTLMKTVISHLEEIEKKRKKKKDKGYYRSCKTVWFQAWKYKDEDEILAALIEEIFKAMKSDGFFEGCKAQIETFVKSLNKLKIIGKFTELFSSVDISDCFSAPEYKSKLGFYDTFQEFFDRLLWTYPNWRPKISIAEGPDDSKGSLVVFIDDLDRCPKDRILKVLETIKLFMDKKGCVFVIGAANDIIEKALEGDYGEGSSKFMDKIVQVTFNLPQVTATDFESYIEKISPHIKADITPHLSMIISAMENNQRRLKRFLNNLSLQEGLLRCKDVQVTFSHLLYWNIIDYVYPSLRDAIKDNSQILSVLKDNIKKIDAKLNDEEKSRWEIAQEMLDEEKVPQSLQDYIKERGLVDILRSFDIDSDQLSLLTTFTEVVESVEEVKEKEEKEKKVELSGFDKMAEVSAGNFLYGGDNKEESIEQAFEIDVYPVTNSQYKKFIETGGYTDNEILQRCWSDDGRTWIQKTSITQPGYWEDEIWNQPELPVVGVCYYEAEAYAKWAGKKLPTENEWEKAARGEDGREYPWEGEFDEKKCNSDESGIGKTSRVDRYPNGVSPYGCYDMAGNVWEWTSDWYAKKQNTIVLRGGSWGNSSGGCRCAGRFNFGPDGRSSFVGFRCARTLTL